jgi:hypothetical protein
VLYHSDAWCRQTSYGCFGAGRQHRRVALDRGTPYRLKVGSVWVNGRDLKVTVAEDATASRTDAALLRIPVEHPVRGPALDRGRYFLAGAHSCP